MTRLKKIISDGVIIYSLFIGFFVILMTTNHYFLSFVEKAVELELNPLHLEEWILLLLWG